MVSEKLKKILIASMNTITNTETGTESRLRILPRLTISVIGWFSPRDHLSSDGKSRRVRIFKISKCFQRSKPRLYLPFSP
jgi:hypothetical protein